LSPINVQFQAHYLCIAAELMANMFEELNALKETDASLSRDLMVEGPAISEQLAALHKLVNRVSAGPDGSGDLELIEQGKAILGPLSRRLETLAHDFEERIS
jgi:hypothetical protein